ncbi:SET domain [Seminavis robusta]|uniref:SET domain n=1 Tax=Seminavis robusta TaxID=568900 RepID=A0A9N8E439_9STRA|nr:SET domain [Seminavis robusta]|eukprot:Sro532_g161390.1 SET domain (512) ;mRNA; f:4503-6038
MNSIPEDEITALSETTEQLKFHDTDNNNDESAKVRPTLNREVLVVENNGIKVCYDGRAKSKSLCRTTVATRSFDTLYVPILIERPATICASGDFLAYLEQFLNAPEDVQLAILDCSAQPLDSPMGQSLVEPAKVLFLLEVIDDFDLIHRLLSIYATNAHQYKEDDDGGIGCLPLFGSKMNHSCDGGNVRYLSQSSIDGCVEYTVTKPIQKGDIVSVTYLTDLFETPTPERRQILFDTKHFWCECDRCNGPDYCRFLPCPECSKFIACVYAQNSSDHPLWKCPTCDLDSDDNDHLIVLERQMEQTLTMMERSVQKETTNFNRIPEEVTPADLKEVVQECSEKLSPTHYLTMKALRLLVTVCTCSAYVQTKRLVVRGGWTNHQILAYHRAGVQASFRSIAACECVAAGCPGCTLLVTAGSGEGKTSKGGTAADMFPHAPLFDRAAPVHRACEELTKYLPPHYWPSYTVTIFTRYQPLLHVMFGRAAMEEIETKLLPWNQASCLPCGTVWSGSL